MREHSYNATGKDDATMAKHSYSKRNRNKVDHRKEIAKDGPPAIVSRKYNVTSMTAYHIAKLAAADISGFSRKLIHPVWTSNYERKCLFWNSNWS